MTCYVALPVSEDIHNEVVDFAYIRNQCRVVEFYLDSLNYDYNSLYKNLMNVSYLSLEIYLITKYDFVLSSNRNKNENKIKMVEFIVNLKIKEKMNNTSIDMKYIFIIIIGIIVIMFNSLILLFHIPLL